MNAIDRRAFLVSAALTAACSALPVRVAARPGVSTEREQHLLRLAREQLARVGSRVVHRDIVAFADFGAHSAEPRFYFADMLGGTVQWSCRVAHGTGSDPDNDGWLTRFSNMAGSNATSRGAYVTHGRVGTGSKGALGLIGLDADNASAIDRSVTILAANYCSDDHVARWGRTGRSKGGFALAPQDFRRVVAQLHGGRLLYADRLDLTGIA